MRGLIRCAVSESLRNRNSLGVTATPAAVGETSTTPEVPSAFSPLSLGHVSSAGADQAPSEVFDR